MLHCAEYSRFTKDLKACEEWCQRCVREYSLQVQSEDELGLEISPYFRSLDVVHLQLRNEIILITVIVKPSWDILKEILGKEIEGDVHRIDCYLRHVRDRLSKTELTYQ